MTPVRSRSFSRTHQRPFTRTHALIAALVAAVATLAAASQVRAQPHDGHGHGTPAPAPSASAPAAEVQWTEAEIRKVDAEARKFTLRHGPIRHLEMGGMTMVFKLKDPAWVDQFKAGDKVRVKLDRAPGGGFIVNEIEPRKEG